jgi:outer membrane biosynthesis protein TonB
MMSEREQEKKNQRIAFLSTLGIQVVVFLLLFVMVAYSPPNPPNPQVGIELNLGFDDQGGGDNPATTPVGDEGNQPEESKVEPEEVKQEEVKEEVVEETKPTETKATEEVVSTTAESPVSVKKEEKPIEKPKVKVEEKKPEVKPEKPANTYTPTENKTAGTKEGKAGSEGTDEGKTGNKGKEEGTLVKGGQYTGTPGGGGGGSSLELSGWAWDKKPNPDVPNNESGRVVFEIKVDDNGDIVSIKTLERSVSQEAEQICRKAIEKLTFIQTGDNVPAISTGKITFVVRSK